MAGKNKTYELMLKIGGKVDGSLKTACNTADKNLAALESELGDGLVITQLDGLHAGANVTSGDFSLLSKGYLLEGGKRVRPVEQITIAGNFYELLKNIRAVGSDLVFPGSGVGAPSLDVGERTVSGK